MARLVGEAGLSLVEITQYSNKKPHGRKVREAETVSFVNYSSRVHGLDVLTAMHGGHSEEATLKVS
jgi:hypothetical protein